MPQSLWSQDIFSKGELSPLMYSRVTVNAYYNGLKTATNCITYPQGAVGKRFGTLYNATIPYITNYNEAFFQSFQYLNECVYIIIFVPDKILIYLEGILIATVTSTGIQASEIRSLDSTVLDALFRTSTGIFKPKDLSRSASTPVTITGVADNEFTLGTAGTAGYILPIQFTTSGALPTTTPQIRLLQTYFAYWTSTTTVKIFSSAEAAKLGVDFYTLTTAGTGTNNIVPYNTWTFSDVVFRNYPVYDFTSNYDASAFTPAAVTGYNIVITRTSGAFNFTAAYVGGAFIGNGGIARIIATNGTTTANVNIIKAFGSTAAIPGTAAFIAEPAWSDARGWPAKCSSFQNRACFANTGLLPNGLWLSVTNDYDDFDGLEDLDTNAISWYPSSDNVNYIRFIVPYRSLTIHTNTGIYSTPLSFEQAVTPSNFSMTLQDSTPATAIQPRGIDNQIIILSGNDVHSMLWDGFNNSYTSNIASIANEHLIRSPHDEAAYVDLNKAGSRYMFIINDDGSMVIFQTLISEDVSGFSPATLNQSFGNAYFRWVTSSSNGRAWFLTEREIAIQGSTYSINGYTLNTLFITQPFNLLNGQGFFLLLGEAFDLLIHDEIFPIGIPTPFEFTTTDTLPISDPQVEEGVFYWAVGTDDLDFYVYLNIEDAEAGTNNILFYSAGVGASVIPFSTETEFMLEELSFDVFTDCTYVYSGAPQSSFTGLARFNTQTVKTNGDGFGFESIGEDDTVTLEAHGALVEVSEAAIGFPIQTEITPLQVCPPGVLGPKGSSLVWPQHIRYASFMFNDTIGGFINDEPIQLNTFSQTTPGIPPEPSSGVMEVGFMEGWNLEETNGITITHDDPFDIKLIGIFYKIES